jgi:hypothetical protein
MGRASPAPHVSQNAVTCRLYCVSGVSPRTVW